MFFGCLLLSWHGRILCRHMFGKSFEAAPCPGVGQKVHHL